MLTRVALAMFGMFALCASWAASQANPQTPIFTCGEDEKLPPIQLHWTNAVLAGDGRLYSPCRDGSHALDHRESREAALIGQGRFWYDGEIRWRAAQAQARNSARALLFPDGMSGNPPRAGSREFVLQQVDGLGGLLSTLTVNYACNPETQVLGGASPRTWQPGRLFFMLTESTGVGSFGATGPGQGPSLEFRRRIGMEGAYAIGVLLARRTLDAGVVSAAVKEVRGCYTAPPPLADNRDVAPLMIEAVGLARYGTDAEITDAENFLIQESRGTVLKALGAAKGLEALIRQHPGRTIGENTRLRLRQLATYGDRTIEPAPLEPNARIRRLALMTLQSARDLDLSTLQAAATDKDWQVRRLAAGALSLSDPAMAALGEALEADSSFQVRYELLSPVSRRAAETHDCAPIVRRFADASPVVVMRAMDLMPATCADLDDVVKRLSELAGRNGSLQDDANWHINSRALTALVRLRPAEARPLMAGALKSAVWQVRAVAAAATAALNDEASAATLARDPEPNVQTAAIDALARMRSPAGVAHAIDVLNNGSDYQLLRAAALALAGLPGQAKENASNALLLALQKLTAQASDTSRDTRVAILGRLAETLPSERSGDLLPFVGDYDDAVNDAAVKSYATVTRTPPPPHARRGRYPFQPPASALSSLPTEASIQLEEGTVTLRLLPDAAPVTIARFAALARQGYYNGLTFHRVVPNFVVQGGSPGANEYSGVSRFMRDEVGPQGVHVRGAVGISTRGGDTGDGQIFIDLVDLPRLDRDYTVFAYVTQGMELVDRLLEGAKIVSVSVK